jgi:hypothetical protein
VFGRWLVAEFTVSGRNAGNHDWKRLTSPNPLWLRERLEITLLQQVFHARRIEQPET